MPKIYTDHAGNKYRAMSAQEIDTAQNGFGKVSFACRCGETGWMTKAIAVSNTGGYTGARNIFYTPGNGRPECRCPPRDLFAVTYEMETAT